ncbi:MAG: hypothetical protein O3A19_03545 [Planctomycetota bacterium]|nr:hypothetical protein [Planctomycetota bacterium]MDA1025480.1 hypothetical protein [Planctomycetota bacterium]
MISRFRIKTTGMIAAAVLLQSPAAVGDIGDPPPAAAADVRIHPAAWRRENPPRIAVAEAAATMLDGRGILLGGFTADLRATPAVQVRDPRRGWEPVGCSLLVPRASATVVALDDDRLLVIGGWTGRLPTERTWLANSEICEPLRPQNRRVIPVPFILTDPDGLEGHSATRLADGRVLLVHRDEMSIFDPANERWSVPSPLRTMRRHAAVAVVSEHVVIVAGGQVDPTASGIETIDIPPRGSAAPAPKSMAWTTADLPALRDSTLITIATGRVLLVGGELDGESERRTWILDSSTQTVTAGPLLPIEGGIADASLRRSGSGILVVGGERRTAGRPSPASGGAIIRLGRSSIWRLPAATTVSIRPAILELPMGIEKIGGYRFDFDGEDRRRAKVFDGAESLRLVPVVIAD